MDKLCMCSHVQNNIVPKSNQQVFAPTAARALMTAHADPFNTLEPSLWTSGYIGCGWGRKSTWASLALQSRLWICIESSFFHVWPMAFLGKQQHKITKNNHHQVAICYAKCAFCNLSNNTFNATVCTVDAACWLS